MMLPLKARVFRRIAKLFHKMSSYCYNVAIAASQKQVDKTAKQITKIKKDRSQEVAHVTVKG